MIAATATVALPLVPLVALVAPAAAAQPDEVVHSGCHERTNGSLRVVAAGTECPAGSVAAPQMVEARDSVEATIALERVSARAECPDGTKVPSGGYEVFGDAKVVSSTPLVAVSLESWIVVAANGRLAAEVRASAVRA